jgi:hypothetical protein
MTFAAHQSAFAGALRDPSASAPDGLSATAPTSRFAVYRNNVSVGLMGALEARYPAVRSIVGDAFFRELARDFTRRHPPRSPVMIEYGETFPAFLETVEALDELPYLADIARLESARVRAYHAADAAPLGADAFASLPPEAIDGLKLVLHPSLALVRSRFPVVTIWAMNAGEAPLAAIEDWSAEDALVLRPAFQVEVLALPPGGGAFLSALLEGAALGDAAAAALDETSQFDLATGLVGIVEAGGIVRLSSRPAQHGETPSWPTT